MINRSCRLALATAATILIVGLPMIAAGSAKPATNLQQPPAPPPAPTLSETSSARIDSGLGKLTDSMKRAQEDVAKLIETIKATTSSDDAISNHLLRRAEEAAAAQIDTAHLLAELHTSIQTNIPTPVAEALRNLTDRIEVMQDRLNVLARSTSGAIDDMRQMAAGENNLQPAVNTKLSDAIADLGGAVDSIASTLQTLVTDYQAMGRAITAHGAKTAETADAVAARIDALSETVTAQVKRLDSLIVTVSVHDDTIKSHDAAISALKPGYDDLINRVSAIEAAKLPAALAETDRKVEVLTAGNAQHAEALREMDDAVAILRTRHDYLEERVGRIEDNKLADALAASGKRISVIENHLVAIAAIEKRIDRLQTQAGKNTYDMRALGDTVEDAARLAGNLQFEIKDLKGGIADLATKAAKELKEAQDAINRLSANPLLSLNIVDVRKAVDLAVKWPAIEANRDVARDDVRRLANLQSEAIGRGLTRQDRLSADIDAIKVRLDTLEKAIRRSDEASAVAQTTIKANKDRIGNIEARQDIVEKDAETALKGLAFAEQARERQDAFEQTVLGIGTGLARLDGESKDLAKRTENLERGLADISGPEGIAHKAEGIAKDLSALTMRVDAATNRIGETVDRNNKRSDELGAADQAMDNRIAALEKAAKEIGEISRLQRQAIEAAKGMTANLESMQARQDSMEKSIATLVQKMNKAGTAVSAPPVIDTVTTTSRNTSLSATPFPTRAALQTTRLEKGWIAGIAPRFAGTIGRPVDIIGQFVARKPTYAIGDSANEGGIRFLGDIIWIGDGFYTARTAGRYTWVATFKAPVQSASSDPFSCRITLNVGDSKLIDSDFSGVMGANPPSAQSFVGGTDLEPGTYAISFWYTCTGKNDGPLPADGASIAVDFAVKGPRDPQLQPFGDVLTYKPDSIPSGTPISTAEATPAPAPAQQPTIATASAIVIDPMQEVRQVKTNANVRAAPSTDAATITTLSAGSNVAITGRVKGTQWYQIMSKSGDQRAYMHASVFDAAPTTINQSAEQAAPGLGECRPYETFRDFGAGPAKVRGRACFGDDGKWHPVEEEKPVEGSN